MKNNIAITFSLLLAFVFVAFSCIQKSKVTPPNILFICVDDLRPQTGAYGEKYMVTPNLDQLASEGRLFNKHYAIVPTCGASRFSMLNAVYPKTREQLENSIFRKNLKSPTTKPESLVEVLKQGGYYTVGMGKISHSGDGLIYEKTDASAPVMELPNSWDEFHYNPGNWGKGDDAILGYAGGENRQSLFRQVPPYERGEVDDVGYPDGLMANLAVDQLDNLKNSKKPFFLAVGFFKPHLPFTAPAKYWDLYDEQNLPLAKVQNIPENTSRASFHNSSEFNKYEKGEERPDLDHPLSAGYSRLIRHAYFASVSYVDAQIGKVLDALKAKGLADNTIVVIWGDHGWHLGDQSIWGKHTLSEYSLRSTLIIKAPGMKDPGKPSNAVVESIDIFPTLMELVGLRVPDFVDGKSLSNIIDDSQGRSDGIAFGYYRNGLSLRTDRYRLTRYFREQQPTIELYDYKIDPHESNNVAAKRPLIVDSLMMILKNGNSHLYEKKSVDKVQ